MGLYLPLVLPKLSSLAFPKVEIVPGTPVFATDRKNTVMKDCKVYDKLMVEEVFQLSIKLEITVKNGCANTSLIKRYCSHVLDICQVDGII